MLHDIAGLGMRAIAQVADTEAGDSVLSGVDMDMLFKLGFVVVIVAIWAGVSAAKTMARERTRREIAAYIAEGSMTPEQAERVIAARFKDK